MLGSLAVGEVVVVQFGSGDAALTRCTVTAAATASRGVELRPLDPLSGSAKRGDRVRATWVRAGRTHGVDAIVAEDGTPSRLELMAERRRDERVTVDLRVGITIAGEPSPVRGVARDLSIGGLRAELHETLPSGQRGHMRIFGGDDVLIELDAEVVAASSTGSLDPRDLHLRFVDLTDATRVRLAEIISERKDRDLRT